MVELDIPKATENAPCPLCGGFDAKIVARKARFGMDVTNVCCRNCAAIYITPRPTAAAMAEYYRETYRKHYGDVAVPGADGTPVRPSEPGFDDALWLWHSKQAHLAANVAKTPRKARVLEIGCRHGMTLSMMQHELGIQPFGIEPGEAEARLAHDAGIECFVGALENYTPPDELFDQVQLFHALEHFDDPLASLLRIRDLLKPSGIVLIEVPNAYRPYGLLEENFFQNVHLTTFSPNTLFGMLQRAGFQVETMLNRVTLIGVGRRIDTGAKLPLPFDRSMLPNSTEDCDWLEQKLHTYANLEKLRFILKRQPDRQDLLPMLFKVLMCPAFPEHMSEVVADFIDFFAKQKKVDEMIRIMQAVINGPHPNNVKHDFKVFLERLAPPAASA